MSSRLELISQTVTPNSGPVTISSTSSLESFNLPLNAGTDVAIEAILSTPSQPYSFQKFDFPMQPVANPLARAPPDTGNTSTQGPSVQTSFSPGVVSLSGQSLVPIMPSTQPATATALQTNNNTVAEFLYQLTKMLTDNNKETIEWTNGKIEVHNPHKLASDVLHKYFRHSKFASFQRQLNYFGFRKLAGKGKMAPCSYVNEATTMDFRSILAIKRKTTATIPKEKPPKKRERMVSNEEANQQSTSTAPVHPVLVGILQRTPSTSLPCDVKRGKPESPTASAIKVAVGKGIKHQLNGFLKGQPGDLSHLNLAKSAVGKGVRHNFIGATSKEADESVANETVSSENSFTFKEPHQLGMDIQSSLNELSNNFHNSLKQSQESDAVQEYFSMLRRDDSLVDLAMFPSIEPTSVSEMQQADAEQAAANAEAENNYIIMPFLDFTHDVMDPI